MKKYLLAPAFVLGVFFITPVTVTAQFDYTCSPPCAANQYCDSDLTCKSISNTLTQPQGGGGINIGALRPYSDGIINVINGVLVPVLFAIAFIVFLWGIFKLFIWGRESESDKMEGRKYAMWGIIGFVIILSVWGLVALVRGTLNLTNTNAPTPPTIGTGTN